MSAKQIAKYSFFLSLAVTLGFFGLILGLLISGRNAIWYGDELSQYVNYLLYYGRTFRSAVSSLLAGNGFNFPAYTLYNGYGTDVYVLLAGTVADPFNLPAIVCPGRYVEYLYVGTILERLLGCAFAFFYYCLRRGNSLSSSFIASLCYTFCGGIVFIGAIRHPFFLTGAAYLPLILAGIDKVFEDKSPCLFVCMMALQLLASAFLAYVACFAMLAYCLIKYFGGTTRKKSVKDFVLLVLRFVGLLILAFCIAGVTVVPRFTSILSQERLGLSRYKALFFDAIDYIRISTDVIGATFENYAYYFGAVGLLILIVFVVGLKYFEKREGIVLLLCLLAVVVGMLLPIVGRAFNGFSYSTTRWLFVAQFCCAYIVCRTVPVIKQLNERDWRNVTIAATLYIVVCIVCEFVVKSPAGRGVLAVLFFCLVLAWLPQMARLKQTGRLIAVLSILLLVNITLVSTFRFLPTEGGMAKNYVRTGQAYKSIMKKSYASAMDKIDDDDWYRYSPSEVYVGVKNASLNHKNCSIDFYRSNYNQPIDNLRTELGIADGYFFNFLFHGSDSRLALEGLTGSKYFVVKKGDLKTVPYGYTFLRETKNGYQVWVNTHVLPLAFATTNAIDREQYEELTMIQKQEALVQGCVVKDAASTGCQTPDLQFSSSQQECKISSNHNVIVKDGEFIVLRNGGNVTLEFEGKAASETYLQFLNLNLEYIKPTELYALRNQEVKTRKESIELLRSQLFGRLPDSYAVSVSCNGISRRLNMGTNRHPQYGGKHNWLINLGYTNEPQTSATLKFSVAGRYTFDDLSVAVQPVEPIAAQLDSLARNGATQTAFDGYTFTATFNTQDDSMLAVATLPYSPGWSATVDGTAAKVYRADTGFVAVRLNSRGEHTVRFYYTTPGLVIGYILSAAGIATGIGLMVWTRRRRRTREQESVGGHFSRA